MIKFLAALLFVLVPVLARPQAEVLPHIVGGTPVPDGSYPFMVSLRRANGDFYCGGSLVSKQFVLTAAHCIKPVNQMKVGLGSVRLADQVFYDVEKAFVYPEYGGHSTDHDIALIKLKKPLKLDDKVQTINFPYTKTVDDKNVTAMGWGRTGARGPISPVLLQLERKALSNSECNKRFGQSGSKVKDGHLCLGSSLNFGVCFGDSGGPLLHVDNNKNYVVGVVSWGIPCATGLPDVYSRVSHYSKWLESTMKK